MRDATHVLDGLLYHESDLRIEEHYTDTLGFTDHVFFLCHALGFRFAPRICDLADRRLYVPGKARDYPHLALFVGEPLRVPHIRTHWDAVQRLVASIKHGTVSASLMLRKLGSYPRQNGIALALRELGRIERTLFMLDWLLDPTLRQRVTAGLNKGELKNTLARAVCCNRLGELRDRTFDAQRYRASGLNLVVAAIILWNTVYLERAVAALRADGRAFDPAWLPHLAPVHWDHINLTGDYSGRTSGSSAGDSGRCGRRDWLSVLYSPFRQTTPSAAIGATQRASVTRSGDGCRSSGSIPTLHIALRLVCRLCKAYLVCKDHHTHGW